MRNRRIIIHNQPHALRIARLQHIPLGRIRIVLALRLQQQRIVVIAVELLVVEAPHQVSGRVHHVVDHDAEGLGRMRVRRDGVVRRRQRQVVVAAFPLVGIGPRLRGRARAGVGAVVVDLRQRLRLVRQVADRGDVGAHPVGAGGLSGGLDDDVGALADLIQVSAGKESGADEMRKAGGDERHLLPGRRVWFCMV